MEIRREFLPLDSFPADSSRSDLSQQFLPQSPSTFLPSPPLAIPTSPSNSSSQSQLSQPRLTLPPESEHLSLSLPSPLASPTGEYPLPSPPHIPSPFGPHFLPAQPDRHSLHSTFTFPPPPPPPQHSFLVPPATPQYLEIKALQHQARESEELARNLEFQLHMNQLRHLQKLLNYQASISHMQAIKVSAAADSTAALVNTLETSVHQHPLHDPLKGINRSTLVQDHIRNVSKTLRVIFQNPYSPTSSPTSMPFPPPFPMPSPSMPSPSMPSPMPTPIPSPMPTPMPASMSFPYSTPVFPQTEEAFHPYNLLTLEGEFKRLREAATSSLRHPLSLSTLNEQSQLPTFPDRSPFHPHPQTLQQQHQSLVQQITAHHQRLGLLSAEQQMAETRSKLEDTISASTSTMPTSNHTISPSKSNNLLAQQSHEHLSPGSFNSTASPISPESSSQHSDPSTPTAEEKYLKRRLQDVDDHNKRQKGEKGLFFCEDPTCGAELKTRSGFRRHRQKHASGHVLRKRARKEEPSKASATPATIVSHRPTTRPSNTPHTPMAEFPALFTSDGLSL